METPQLCCHPLVGACTGYSHKLIALHAVGLSGKRALAAAAERCFESVGASYVRVWRASRKSAKRSSAQCCSEWPQYPPNAVPLQFEHSFRLRTNGFEAVSHLVNSPCGFWFLSRARCRLCFPSARDPRQAPRRRWPEFVQPTGFLYHLTPHLPECVLTFLRENLARRLLVEGVQGGNGHVQGGKGIEIDRWCNGGPIPPRHILFHKAQLSQSSESRIGFQEMGTQGLFGGPEGDHNEAKGWRRHAAEKSVRLAGATRISGSKGPSSPSGMSCANYRLLTSTYHNRLLVGGSACTLCASCATVLLVVY